MAEKKIEAPRPPVTSYLSWDGRRAFITDEKLAALRKDRPEAIQEGNSVRPDRVQVSGRWYALELANASGRRELVSLTLAGR